MIASITSQEFKSARRVILKDQRRYWFGLGAALSSTLIIFGIISLFAKTGINGIPMIVMATIGLIYFWRAARQRVEELASEQGLRCNGCGEPLISITTVRPNFPIGICTRCGSDTISDLTATSANYTILLERRSFSKGFYKSLGEETAKICLIAVKCFIGAMAAVAGLVLAAALLVSALKKLLEALINNG